ERPDQRHRTTHGGLISQLAALSRGQRKERLTVVRHHLAVCGDHRFACEERRPDVIDGRLGCRNGLDHDVDVRGKEAVEPIGPGELSKRLGLASLLVACAAIEEVSESEAGKPVRSGQPAGDGGSYGADAEDADTTAFVAWAVARCLE